MRQDREWTTRLADEWGRDARTRLQDYNTTFDAVSYIPLRMNILQMDTEENNKDSHINATEVFGTWIEFIVT